MSDYWNQRTWLTKKNSLFGGHFCDFFSWLKRFGWQKMRERSFLGGITFVRLLVSKVKNCLVDKWERLEQSICFLDRFFQRNIMTNALRPMVLLGFFCLPDKVPKINRVLSLFVPSPWSFGEMEEKGREILLSNEEEGFLSFTCGARLIRWHCFTLH